MPTLDKVTVLIGNRAHQIWESYDIQSDLMTPADAWHVSLGLKTGQLPDFVEPWSPVEIKIGNDTVMIGRVDELADAVTKSERTLSMSGRDGAAVLVDCAAPIWVARLASLEEIVAKVVRPLGIHKVVIDAEATSRREKINVEPGDRAWDTLRNAAEANGLWPWFTPDGTLVIGGPDYSAPTVATLVMNRDGKGNNVEELERKRSASNRYSEVTVLGQTHGTETEEGKNALKATAQDSGVSWYRPQVVVDHESDSAAICRDRARKLLADSRLSSFELVAKVKGHRIKEGGALWTPGQRVHVVSEPHGIDGVFFLMSRRFTGSRQDGQRTELMLKEDGIWALDAHPHKRKHRRGKNDSPGEILDVG
ncbi:phage baseplate assembly protein [Methylophilus sp. YYY-1]|uniref:phage baseplate assembly protein n=1 Tax=Methylophilus sp. YYY-1 TaxID=2682087 RepID=UPI0023B30533|nr:phage tail protein [Methylophilus sp. YYY-1]MDF0377701.1 phage tail protein [Methylophilus sp. YYY-1]